VINVTGSAVTLDANNPLAGKDLKYEIELVAIVKRN
jgi:FKBP-type peptidyl-prolyl cis-trans isomerase 2